MRSGGGGGRRLLLAGWLRRLVVRAGSALLALAVRAQLWITQTQTRSQHERRRQQPRQRRNRPPTCVCAVLCCAVRLAPCSLHSPPPFSCLFPMFAGCERSGEGPRGGGTQRADGREASSGWLLLLLGFNVQCTRGAERQICTTSPPTKRSHGEMSMIIAGRQRGRVSAWLNDWPLPALRSSSQWCLIESKARQPNQHCSARHRTAQRTASQTQWSTRRRRMRPARPANARPVATEQRRWHALNQKGRN